MAKLSGIERTPLANGAIAVFQRTSYGELSCESRYSLLPDSSERAQSELAEWIALEHVASLKAEKRRAAAAEAAEARVFYGRLGPLIAQFRKDGLSFAAIAVALNAAGERTRTGLRWSASSVAEANKKITGRKRS